MRLQILSDLHLETQPDWTAAPAPDADLLVLAGDIGSYQRGSALAARGDAEFGLARFSPLRAWPTPVLFVPGNHEYDGLDFDTTHERLRATCERLGITWLEREARVIDGVRFVGTTLWTDFDALVHPPGEPPPTTAQALKRRDKAFRAANFYLRKAATQRRGELMLAEAWRELGLACQAWLRAELARPHAGPTVVITHFAPSLRSADPRYGRQPGTASFCNADDDLIARADLWLHGHLHCRHDYRVPRPGRAPSRVVCQARGLAGKGEAEGHDAAKLIEL